MVIRTPNHFSRRQDAALRISDRFRLEISSLQNKDGAAVTGAGF